MQNGIVDFESIQNIITIYQFIKVMRIDFSFLYQLVNRINLLTFLSKHFFFGFYASTDRCKIIMIVLCWKWMISMKLKLYIKTNHNNKFLKQNYCVTGKMHLIYTGDKFKIEDFQIIKQFSSIHFSRCVSVDTVWKSFISILFCSSSSNSNGINKKIFQKWNEYFSFQSEMSIDQTESCYSLFNINLAFVCKKATKPYLKWWQNHLFRMHYLLLIFFFFILFALPQSEDTLCLFISLMRSCFSFTLLASKFRFPFIPFPFSSCFFFSVQALIPSKN